MEIVGFKVNKKIVEEIEKKIKDISMEMENCLDNISTTTCYELIRTDNELIWIRFNHNKNKIEIIREEQS